jgi:hypothetical protein
MASRHEFVDDPAQRRRAARIQCGIALAAVALLTGLIVFAADDYDGFADDMSSAAAVAARAYVMPVEVRPIGHGEGA